MSKALHLENIEKAQSEILAKRDRVQSGKMRQRYHFMAEAGWINDPNGVIFFRGKYHLFYQFNPYDAYWGAMHWGHAISEDLVHWEHLPVALAPSEPYDNHEKGGCFSGSAIEYQGKLFLIYTGTTNDGEGFVQTQCVAYSEDGVHFEKYKGNPVIRPPKEVERDNFRDPKVWEHEGIFYMVCGAKSNNLAKALLYCSKDLFHWEYVNVLAESRGEFGYMFECPDFFPLEDKWVLMFSPMGVYERTKIYLVGDMDYSTGKFSYTSMGEIDWGLDYYAPQSFLDGKGRRLMISWANAWDWMPWWKDWGPSFQEGWCGFYNIPRQAKLLPDGKIQFVPVEELEILRYDEKKEFDIVVGQKNYEISSGDGVAFESKILLDIEKTTAPQVYFSLRAGNGKESMVTINLQKSEMIFDRNNSDGWSKGCSRSLLNLNGKKYLDIHIFSDQSSIEIFTDNYQTNHSNNVFADNAQNCNVIYTKEGRAVFKSVYSWGLKSV